MLKVTRQNAGLQQGQVARMLGHRSAITLCRWEAELKMPCGANLMRLCILYGKTPEELYPEYYGRLAAGLERQPDGAIAATE
jgi:hypothetical protein